MERELYATDGDYYLYPLSEEDRENYVELHRQINGGHTLFLNPVCRDMMWKQAIGGEIKIYSIFDFHREYCGSIEVQNPLSKTPEIGVDLLVDHRNKGIAPCVVKLLTNKFIDSSEVDYFVIRISSRNPHSKHVFEKLGAVLIGEEDSAYKKIMNSFRAVMGEEALSKAEDSIKEILSGTEEMEDERVYRYKYIPQQDNLS